MKPSIAAFMGAHWMVRADYSDQVIAPICEYKSCEEAA